MREINDEYEKQTRISNKEGKEYHVKTRSKSKETATTASALHTAVTPVVPQFPPDIQNEANPPPDGAQLQTHNTHTNTQTDTSNKIRKILERCEARLQQYGFLSKVNFGISNTEGAVDFNGKQKYVSDYDHWRIYKESFDKTLAQLKT